MFEEKRRYLLKEKKKKKDESFCQDESFCTLVAAVHSGGDFQSLDTTNQSLDTTLSRR